MSTIRVIEEVDNTGTLYEEVLLPNYGYQADIMLVNSKLLRAYILKMIKEFVDSEFIASIKEFSTVPTMTYATDVSYKYEGIKNFTTDLVIVNNIEKMNT